MERYTLPFEKYPHHLIVEIIYNTLFWLNCFPHKDGIHPTLSPRTIVMGTTINYDKHCRVPFGTYIQVHEQHNNSMASCTSSAIALRPSGNSQGSYYFLNLHSGKCIICNNWMVLLMPNEVINTIHQLAAAFNKYKDITFTDKDRNIMNEENNDNEDNIEITGVNEETYSQSPENTQEQIKQWMVKHRAPIGKHIAPTRTTTRTPTAHQKIHRNKTINKK